MKADHLWRLRQLGSTRVQRAAITQFLAAFGILSGGIQFAIALWGPLDRVISPVKGTIGVVGAALMWALLSATPRLRVSRQFRVPDVKVSLEVGDLLEDGGSIVVGFGDTFDTDQTDGSIIDPRSVQGQLVRRRYGGESRLLDEELGRSLAGSAPVAVESRTAKAQGKLRRYPIGTTVALGTPEARIIGVVMAETGPDCEVRSSVDSLWRAFGAVWVAAERVGSMGKLKVPIVGTRFGRIAGLDRGSIVKLLLLSFMAHAREKVPCEELVVVVHPSDLGKIDMRELSDFLMAL